MTCAWVCSYITVCKCSVQKAYMHSLPSASCSSVAAICVLAA